MFSHAGFYTGVVAEAFEEAEGLLRVSEIGEGTEGGKCVGCFVLGFFPVAVAGGFSGGGFGGWFVGLLGCGG